jgi:TRAP-type C4-dicarboxylate transport system permease small subunit
VALLGASYAYRRRLHVGDDYFVKKMPERVRRASAWGGFAVELLFFVGVMGFGGARLVAITFQLGQATSVLHWPMGLVYLVIPLSGALMAIFAVDARRGEVRS